MSPEPLESAVLDSFFDLAQFVVILAAGWQYLMSRQVWRRKKQSLEAYLLYKKETALEGQHGQHTIAHLIRHLGLTQDELLQISFESKHVDRVVSVDEQGKADQILLHYLEQKPATAY